MKFWTSPNNKAIKNDSLPGVVIAQVVVVAVMDLVHVYQDFVVDHVVVIEAVKGVH